MTGCTISVSLVMNMIFKLAEVGYRGPMSTSVTQQPLHKCIYGWPNHDGTILSWVLIAPSGASVTHLMDKNKFQTSEIWVPGPEEDESIPVLPAPLAVFPNHATTKSMQRRSISWFQMKFERRSVLQQDGCNVQTRPELDRNMLNDQRSLGQNPGEPNHCTSSF